MKGTNKILSALVVWARLPDAQAPGGGSYRHNFCGRAAAGGGAAKSRHWHQLVHPPRCPTRLAHDAWDRRKQRMWVLSDMRCRHTGRARFRAPALHKLCRMRPLTGSWKWPPTQACWWAATSVSGCDPRITARCARLNISARCRPGAPPLCRRAPVTPRTHCSCIMSQCHMGSGRSAAQGGQHHHQLIILHCSRQAEGSARNMPCCARPSSKLTNELTYFLGRSSMGMPLSDHRLKDAQFNVDEHR